MIDNIIVGELVEDLTLDDLGVGEEELNHTVSITAASEMEFFLPRILVHAGVFKTTSEVKRINKDRVKSTKITDPDSKNLWRTLTRPEMTHFKIGKKVFWLVVGNIST